MKNENLTEKAKATLDRLLSLSDEKLFALFEAHKEHDIGDLYLGSGVLELGALISESYYSTEKAPDILISPSVLAPPSEGNYNFEMNSLITTDVSGNSNPFVMKTLPKNLVFDSLLPALTVFGNISITMTSSGYISPKPQTPDEKLAQEGQFLEGMGPISTVVVALNEDLDTECQAA